MDDPTKAISGHLTRAAEMRASMMRIAAHGYDPCRIGNTKDSNATRDMLITSIKSHLGQE
jgi:hypothetical protein